MIQDNGCGYVFDLPSGLERFELSVGKTGFVRLRPPSEKHDGDYDKSLHDVPLQVHV